MIHTGRLASRAITATPCYIIVFLKFVTTLRILTVLYCFTQVRFVEKISKFRFLTIPSLMDLSQMADLPHKYSAIYWKASPYPKHCFSPSHQE